MVAVAVRFTVRLAATLAFLAFAAVALGRVREAEILVFGSRPGNVDTTFALDIRHGLMLSLGADTLPVGWTRAGGCSRC